MRDRFELRAQNPVASCLIRQLIVPRIYIDADWPGMADGLVDVLAIDRDGKGDAHIVQIRTKAADALAVVPALLKARAPFRWIAFLRGTEDEAAALALISQESLYPPDTAGRVGVIEVVKMAGDDLGANARIKAERFPTPTYDLAASFSASHEAKIQYPG
ncbi:hypothetical protein [Sorangium sp. So ce388]|uniref:hypothetical protein n=1 Tax=Sorangium sp. So ce388 TaxID=3133309 RepID=UPI003F5C9028